MNIGPHGSGAPPLTLLGLEPLRVGLEYAGMRFMNTSDLPKGDGHTVVVFPGLASDRRATAPLTTFCGRLRYEALDWGRGFNTGPSGDPQAWLDELAEHIGSLPSRRHGEMSLIGWSLGGIYARETAKRLKAKVRQVITIGTPFASMGDDTNAGFVYRLLSGRGPSSTMPCVVSYW